MSIAAAALVALLMLAQGAPLDVLSASIATDGAPPPSAAAAEPLDAGVDWHRVERAPDPAGASVAAYER